MPTHTYIIVEIVQRVVGWSFFSFYYYHYYNHTIDCNQHCTVSGVILQFPAVNFSFNTKCFSVWRD